MKKKSVGRPRIAESKKRKVYVCISCTVDEIKMIERKAKEMKVRKSTLIRLAVEKI
jgi:hypothetical protein